MSDLGKIVFTDGGDWSSSVSYEILTIVKHNKATYYSTQPSTGQEPSEDSPYWFLIAKDGEDGTKITSIELIGAITGSGVFDESGNITIETSSSSGSTSQIKAFEAATTVFNSDGSITETASSGNVKTTVFNSDDSITETLADSSGIQIEQKVTTFNADGSINEDIT